MGYKLQDSFGDEIRKKTEEIKDQVVADYDKTKKKKDPELDRNTIKVRLPDETLARLVKLQINSAACKNKGYILDSYPRTLSDAKNIFLEKSSNEFEDSPYPGYDI
jgi:adenylate kinase family enzyme